MLPPNGNAIQVDHGISVERGFHSILGVGQGILRARDIAIRAGVLDVGNGLARRLEYVAVAVVLCERRCLAFNSLAATLAV